MDATTGRTQASLPGGDASTPDGDAARAEAGAPSCTQALFGGPPPPSSARFIVPAHAVVPFYQWESDNGYCGEASLIEAGMNQGQWVSQYNARLLCGAAGNGRDAPVGAPLLQSGPDGFCGANGETPDYNAQLLLEGAAAANAATCLSNFRLAYELYDGANASGLAGYEAFLSWVKARVIAGGQVTIGVLEPSGTDSQYDHIVTVTRIGTNHAATDATYYDDDVLYIEDHGAYTFEGGQRTGDPPIPPGAGSDTAGCTPYVYALAFGALPKTREQANADAAPPYSILMPGEPESPTHTGGDGVGYGPSVIARNYGFAVSGPATTDATLPVTLRITGTTTEGVANPPSPLAGLNYENPFIGTSDLGDSCTNDPPSSWMSVTFEVTVGGLTAGTSYRLYEYDIESISGVGSAAALDVPASAFNASARRASHATSFVATGASFTSTVVRPSSMTVVFRAVPADAP